MFNKENTFQNKFQNEVLPLKADTMCTKPGKEYLNRVSMQCKYK